ncbi:MAG: Hsp20/alpha crystallin family protein [Candidatus Protochlamydia sp.]|nr:Hsp20/alpha crystallin family protein [Candidatus Protochlamydia sp.]
MDDRGKDIIPRSFFRLPSSIPSLWGDMEDKMSQWMGLTPDTGVTVSEDNDHVYVEAHLPGMKTDELDISVHQNTLWIKAEKKEEEEDKEKKFYRRAKNSFFYQVELPSSVEDNTEQANYKDGVLKVTFKKNQQSQKRKISVQNGNGNGSEHGHGNNKKN